MDYLTAEVNEKDSVEYWDNFYREIKIQHESNFCLLIKSMSTDQSVILDIGCGSGRDAFSFAKDGYEVVGIDRSKQAISANKTMKNHPKFKNLNIEFNVVDLGNVRKLNDIIIAVIQRTKKQNKSVIVYVRFLLHSINERTEQILLDTLSANLQKGDQFAAEFRTIEDEGRNKVYDNHYRRFIDADHLLDKLVTKYDFSPILFEKGTGLSIFNNEDPFLGRIVVEKN
ncbi:class I SAM-dependent methyltransferase [Paenibacillus sepulcri]|uniref:Class I SAM-dependent methyltransferase n=1 Tax=Paenibacillus sepulcri TaxID=359917 RepID=A0ABS7BV60_9BACL|nr:class I SAM-dependent methyltransferase [Paenibacillus sepulcri]